MEHPELPIFSFLAAVLVLVPLPWHWQARNTATLSIITWLFVADVIFGVNSLIWAGNVKDITPIWCDISSKITVGASYALPLATLCICKHLEAVSSSRNVSFNYTYRRQRIFFEIIMCFGLPATFMALHYIVQGHRYDIFENMGCQAAVYISIQAVLIIWLPQLLFSVLTVVYAAALHHFIRRRLTFASYLQNSNSALTTNGYLRLIAMALTEMIWGTTLTSYNLYNNVSGGLRPWTTWADVHSNFSRVGQFPEMVTPPEFRRAMMLFWWAMPVSSFIFFLFFGFSGEAKKGYTKILRWCKSMTLRRGLLKKKGATHSSILGSPDFKPIQPVERRKRSMTKSHPISGPALVSPPNPSITTLPTPPAKPEGRQSRFGTTRGKAELHPDARSTFTFSVYARPYDPKPSYRSHRATYSTSSITQASDQPPRFPEIPFPSLLSVSPPVSTVGAPSRTPTVPRGAINHIHTRRVPGGEIV